MTASVFLSYSSEDRQAARSIGEALTGFGLEVWLDESELGGGDAWDQKIRRQIRECDYFMPIVSARTEVRHEGYFRREWRFAVERTLDMADDHLFLLPVVIDATDETRARVPEKFLAVQWLRLPDGQSTPQLEALCRRILAGGAPEPAATRTPPPRAVARGTGHGLPPFPREEPGQRLRFFAHVIGWLIQAAWAYFSRVPRWLRWIVYVWGAIVLIQHGCSSPARHHKDPSTAELERLKTLADRYQGSSVDYARLGEQIAREFTDASPAYPGQNPILAVPFTAPPGDTAGTKLAEAAFTQTYGRLAISHHGHIDLAPNQAPVADVAAAVARAHGTRARYVIFGSVSGHGSSEALTVTIADVDDDDTRWTQSYPAATADPVRIAAEVDAKVPSPDED